MNKLLAVIITAFWAVMWTLLIRTELAPQNTTMREVPVEHVMRLLFHHQQASDLFLHADGTRIGHIRFHPQVRKEDDARLLEFSGNAQMQIPGSARARLAWDSSVEMTPALELIRMTLQTAMRESTTQQVPETVANIRFEANTRKISYEVRTDQTVETSDTLTLDEQGIRGLLERLGIDPMLLQTIGVKKQGPTPRITAHQSSFQLKGEKVDTLLVTAELNGQTLLEVQISQLGQVLRAKTLTGLTLESD